jgi:hypothetical protein
MMKAELNGRQKSKIITRIRRLWSNKKASYQDVLDTAEAIIDIAEEDSFIKPDHNSGIQFDAPANCHCRGRCGK